MNTPRYDRYQHHLQQVSTEQWKTRIIAFLSADWPEWDATTQTLWQHSVEGQPGESMA